MAVVLNPALYKLAAYTLPLVAKPVDICSTANHQSKIIPVSIDFTTFPTFAVQINLNQGTPGQLLDRLSGVYVNNAANVSDLILQCPDTGYQVICPGLQQRFFPLFTRTNIINVYNGELVNSIAAIPGAAILLTFTNFIVDAFSATAFAQVITQVQGSSSVVGGNINQNYYTAVVGDNHIDVIFGAGATGVLGQLIPNPPANAGLFIITNLTISIFNCYSQGAPIALNFGIRYGTAGTIRVIQGVTVNADDKYLANAVLYNQSSEFIILDATQIINAFNLTAVAGGFVSFSFDYVWVLTL